MSIASDLQSVDTKLKNVLSDINKTLVEKKSAKAENLMDVSSKIELISAGDGLNMKLLDGFSYFCYNNQNLQSLSQLDTSNGTNFSFMFSSCYKLTTIPQLDLSNGTEFRNMFSGCYNLTTIPQLNTSNGTDFYGMFYLCYRLTTIPQLDLSNGTEFRNMFYNCGDLTTIDFVGINICNNDFDLSYSSLLTIESLLNVLNALSDNTDIYDANGNPFIVKFGTTNIEKLKQKGIDDYNDELYYINIATSKNIELA
jgi:hypothetical protein